MMSRDPVQRRDPRFTVTVYGSCFSGYMTAATLASSLPDDIRLVHIIPETISVCSALYGGATGPTGYDLLRAAAIEEPDLILKTSATFSYGTVFQNWPCKSRGWVQCFSQPFAGIEDTPFDQLASANTLNLQDYLVSAQAALAGRFAHPPADQNHPLSRAEYGYHIAPGDVAHLAQTLTRPGRVERIDGRVRDIRFRDQTIDALILDSGQVIHGDLFIDCSGIRRDLITRLGAAISAERSLNATLAVTRSDQTEPTCRTLTASSHGWQSVVPLRQSAVTLTLCAAGDETRGDDGGTGFDFQTGALLEAWIVNCVALGNAACTMEPLSTAPTTLLHRGLIRLCELMPQSADMAVERREFNRRFKEDVTNAAAFHRAHFIESELPDTPYWQAAKAMPLGDRLTRKLEQFESRGHCVQYDFEPFNTEDWAILHYGLGRKPRRHDIRIHALPGAAAYLGDLKQAIATLTNRMPPHDQYLTRFSAYLEKKQNDRPATK